MIVAVSADAKEAHVFWSKDTRIDIQVTSTPIQGVSRKLNVTWSTEVADDLKAFHNIDVARDVIRKLNAK